MDWQNVFAFNHKNKLNKQQEGEAENIFRDDTDINKAFAEHKLLFFRKVLKAAIGLVFLLFIIFLLKEEPVGIWTMGFNLFFLTILYWIVRLGRHYTALILFGLVSYIFCGVYPLSGVLLNSTPIVILTIFVIIAYASNQNTIQFINVVVAVLAYITYLISYNYVSLNSIVHHHTHIWEDISLGCCSFIMIFIVSLFYKRHLDIYKEQIQTANIFLKQIININPNQIYIKNRKLEYVYLNKAMKDNIPQQNGDAILGKSMKESWGQIQLPEELLHSDEEVLSTGQPVSFPNMAVNDNKGKKYILNVFKAPIYNQLNEIIGILGVATDITQLVMTREALSEQENEYKTLFENSPLGFAIVDTEGSKMPVDCNAKWLDILKMDKATFMTTNMLVISPGISTGRAAV